ncbi:MAG: sensor histidine kinase [Methanoregula sp.]|nr:sensor histidine kinase [Methanoregula sp.]
MITVDLGKTPQEQEHLILFSMICLGVGILSVDVFIPLGFVIWILYLMPLLMSVWLSYRYAPFYTAWLITFCIFLGSIISGAGQSDPSDLPNRAVFILMMAIVALLVWEIRTNYSTVETEVNERRATQKALEELTRSLESHVAMRTRELSEVNAVLQNDIAKRKKVEAALETANQKLSLLSQITRHDISSRIFNLMVDIDLAKEYAEDVRLKDALEKLELTSISIQDQIAFTKDYQEIGASAPTWHAVAPMVNQAAENLDLQGIEIDIRLGNTEIFADSMVKKVFYNLIDNALRHGDHVTKIVFSSRETAEGLLIVCEDNGVGIPPQDKTRIFDKGFGRDSGLGLFLIREILSITKIPIRETGDYGKGARFEMLIPKGDYRLG